MITHFGYEDQPNKTAELGLPCDNNVSNQLASGRPIPEEEVCEGSPQVFHVKEPAARTEG